APLIAKNLIQPGSVIIDAKSGTTGAGIKAGPTTHFSSVNDNFKAYAISSHRHTIEIEEQFENLASEEVLVQFTPHLLPVDRGILATAYVRLKDESSMDQAELMTVYKEYFQGKPFVRVREQLPTIKEVRGSNFC